MLTVWVLNDKGEKEPASFLVDGYEPETNTVYQSHGCHWHGHIWLKNRRKRQQKRYEDMCHVDWLIENSGWDTKYNLVSTWECEEPILKKVRLEKSLRLILTLQLMILRQYWLCLMNILQTT